MQGMSENRISTVIVVALMTVTAPRALAQSPIFGLDVRQETFFRTETSHFVASYTPQGPVENPIYAVDFDSTARVLWGIQNDTLEYGYFDLLDGTFVALGTVSGPTHGVTGLTSTVHDTWYASEYVAEDDESILYVGHVTTGTFSRVGFTSTGIIIDISADSNGDLYAHNISDDSLYSIDTANGLGTIVGPTGQQSNFAQGMDFDWSSGTLYAALYSTGGAGVFARMNLTTGEATVLEDTTSLGGEFEFAVQRGWTPEPGIPVCFGDGSGNACPCGNLGGPGEGCANGTGSGAVLRATGTADLTEDTMRLTCEGVINGAGLFFQGDTVVGGGHGVLFGDGLRCCGGGIVRLQVVNPPGSTSPATAQMTETATAIGPPGTISPGDSKCYQYWYRDPATSPCTAGFNLSNGLLLTWGLGGGKDAYCPDQEVPFGEYERTVCGRTWGDAVQAALKEICRPLCELGSCPSELVCHATAFRMDATQWTEETTPEGTTDDCPAPLVQWTVTIWLFEPLECDCGCAPKP